MVRLTLTTWTTEPARTITDHGTYATVADARLALDTLAAAYTSDRYRLTDRGTLLAAFDTLTHTITVLRIETVTDWTLGSIDTSFYTLEGCC